MDVAPQGPPAPAQAAAQQWSFSSMIGTAFRMYMMWTLFSYFFKGTANTTPKSDPVSGKPLPPHFNLFGYQQPMALVVFFSQSETFSFEDPTNQHVWTEHGIYFDDRETNARQLNMTLGLSSEDPIAVANFNYMVKNNTLYSHVFLSKTGFPIDPAINGFDRRCVVYKSKALNRYLRKKANKKISLMSTPTEEEAQKKQEQATTTTVTTTTDVATTAAEQEQADSWLSYWNPHMYLSLVDIHDSFNAGAVPPHILPQLTFDNKSNNYFPIMFFNEFWLLRDQLLLVNDTLTEVPLTMDFYVLSAIKWQLMLQLDMSFQMHQSMGTMGEGESDEFKRMVLETNPYLLAVTVFVSMLHMLFDFLAFKNDISFWKENKSMEGLSVRSLFLNTFCQVIVFLYLLDNDTSWMILISSGIGLGIEFWKIKKAVNVELDRSGSFPRLRFTDKASYTSKTKEYDDLAMKYLSWVLYPLVIGYSIYSLYYETHKSWYSWVVSSLVGAIYMFGFIMMTPQLFINYKLKSVAHLPWKTFMYKALNTFIDDLFAFIIKMPTLHRLSCFRDDLIFFVYLYQRWAYPVDKTRVNEFGQGGEDAPAQLEGAADATATATATTSADASAPAATTAVKSAVAKKKD